MSSRVYGLIAALLFFLGTTSAMARDYDVEVLIFERIHHDAQPLEEAPRNMSGRSMDNHLARIESLASDAVEYETEPGLVHLDPVIENLKLAGYHILRTARWTQPGEVYQHAPIVSLGIPEKTLPHAYIRIYKTATIHADVDIQMSPSSFVSLAENGRPPLQSGATNVEITETDRPLPHYFIAEKRRLKFKEIHYLDHPNFGVILGVWPAEVKEDRNVDL